MVEKQNTARHSSGWGSKAPTDSTGLEHVPRARMLGEITKAEREAVRGIFLEIGELSGGYYPPTTRIESLGSLDAWLWNHPHSTAWVAENNDATVGYVEAMDLKSPDTASSLGAHDIRYWGEIAAAYSRAFGRDVDWSDLCVIERLAVLPKFQRNGAGSLLLGTAVRHATHSGRAPVLTVLEGLTEACALYERAGGLEIGMGRGFSGRTVKWYGFAQG